MYQVKVFKLHGTTTEKTINDWLSENKENIDVISTDAVIRSGEASAVYIIMYKDLASEIPYRMRDKG